MCGRARMAEDHSETKIRFFLEDAELPNFRPSYNICPTQDLFGVTREPSGKRRAQNMHWGIIPKWSKDRKLKFATFNARAEDMLEKRTYAPLWSKRQRCLLVVDGFYEWRKSDKQPFTIYRADKEPLVLAGLYEDWTDPASKETVRTCTVVTTAANEAMSALHDRMPVILESTQWGPYLGENGSPADAYAMLTPAANDVVKYHPVSKAVGNVKNHGPDLAEPITLA